MPTGLRFLILIPVLAVACSRGGGKSTQRPQPTVVERGRCLTQPPPPMPATLTAMTDDESLSPEQEVWLWTYVEVLEGWSRRAWKVCGL